MKITSTALTVTLLFTSPFLQANGQSLKEQFDELSAKEDTVAERIHIEKWEKLAPDDPELYVAWFNYYVDLSHREIVRLDKNGADKEGFAVMSQDTSVKEPVGYMYSEKYYDTGILNQGFEKIEKGIEKFPSRLDMRFGKAFMYGQIADFDNFTKEIIRTIQYSGINKNQWTWSEGKPIEDGRNFMLSAVQDYQVQLYNTGNDSLLDNMEQIAKAVLALYPNNVENLSNLSVVYMLREDYGNALTVLHKAEKLNPDDYIVLNNIAHAYKQLGYKDNAIKYYELAEKYGDNETKAQAASEIRKLKEGK